MRSTLIFTLQLIAASVFAVAAHAAPVSIDGTLGAEWTGAGTVSVGYNPAAPVGNFGAPTNENATGDYTIYTRGDAGYFYVGLSSGTNYAGGLDFTNLYFDTQHTGSTIGFEVMNERAFKPGSPGFYAYTPSGSDIHYALTPGSGSTPSVIEFAVPWGVFTSNSLGVDSLPVATSQVRLNLSQTFGYSVAGGQSFYGNTRLGEVLLPVPEPASVALVGLAAIGAGLCSRRRRS